VSFVAKTAMGLIMLAVFLALFGIVLAIYLTVV
jgi:hypothetical protein